MYPYVKCPTCGCLIGHLYRLFQKMRAIKNEAEDLNEDEKGLMDIFDILGITNYCCKTRMMTARQFNDFLHE